MTPEKSAPADPNPASQEKDKQKWRRKSMPRWRRAKWIGLLLCLIIIIIFELVLCYVDIQYLNYITIGIIIQSKYVKNECGCRWRWFVNHKSMS